MLYIEEWKTKPRNHTVGWRMKKHLITMYKYALHLKGNQVKIKYPKLLEVYVNIEFLRNQIAKNFRFFFFFEEKVSEFYWINSESNTSSKSLGSSST